MWVSRDNKKSGYVDIWWEKPVFDKTLQKYKFREGFERWWHIPSDDFLRRYPNLELEPGECVPVTLNEV